VTRARLRQRHTDNLQLKVDEAVALDQCRAECVENLARQCVGDVANIATIMAVYATDTAAERTDDVQAQWKKTTIEKLKSF